MNVTIVAGYGDQTGYIERVTNDWPERYDLLPHIYAFGTNDPPETYKEHWEEFVDVLREIGRTAVIGISFGVSIAARAVLNYPDIATKAIFISGPHLLSDLNPRTVETKYPMLGKSLSAFDPNALPTERIMTIRPLWDSVIKPSKVMLPGAKNERVVAFGHGLGIYTALAFRAGAIANFIHR